MLKIVAYFGLSSDPTSCVCHFPQIPVFRSRFCACILYQHQTNFIDGFVRNIQSVLISVLAMFSHHRKWIHVQHHIDIPGADVCFILKPYLVKKPVKLFYARAF